MKVLTEPFKEAKEIIETIESFHHEAYFVGGAVRDLILGVEVNDIDIATSATPEQIMTIFQKVIPVGIEHGTVLVRHNGQSYEITTYRENAHIRNQVNNKLTLETDLHYRDFTINSLAMDKSGNLIDLFNGQQDIKKKFIRAVDHAEDRFIEDPLRIIRALRFSSELDFTIEENTLKWMYQLKEQIENIAVERITAEMSKFFAGEFINDHIHYLIDTEIYKFLPIFKDNHTVINKLPKPIIPFHSIGEVVSVIHLIEPTISISTIAKEWKCSNASRKEAEQFVNALQYYNTFGADSLLVYHLDEQYFLRFSKLVDLLYPNKPINEKKLVHLYEKLPIKSRKEIALNGSHLIKLFPNKKQGRWISDLLAQIEKEIIMNQLTNNYQAIEEWVICNPPEVNSFNY